MADTCVDDEFSPILINDLRSGENKNSSQILGSREKKKKGAGNVKGLDEMKSVGQTRDLERKGEESSAEGQSSDQSFSDLGLNEWLVRQYSAVGMSKPTPIQLNCIPPILNGQALYYLVVQSFVFLISTFGN